MRKAAYLILFFFSAFTAQAQQALKGRVIDATTNAPLEFVSVYLNTTTRGTSTNDRGEFQLPVPAGKYEVVASYLGYEPLVHTVQADSLPASILFKLQPREHRLSTVEIQGERDALWYANLEVFKEQFLGRSRIAQGCRLLNPEVLVLEFDPVEALLTVRANGPLQVEHAALGYRLEYLLMGFSYHGRQGYVTYEGYQRYEPLKGGRGKQRRWEKNRLEAYRGSSMHFLRALQKKQLEQEGFNLRRLYRLPNPERPSEEAIAAARAYVRSNGQSVNDSIRSILDRARLPKFVEVLDSKPVPYSEYLHFEGGKARVSFENYMQVVYTGEKEELAYVRSRLNSLTGSQGPQTPSFQTSVISLRRPSAALLELGIFLHPLDVLFEGYWGWEKVGDVLPLDYQP